MARITRDPACIQVGEVIPLRLIDPVATPSGSTRRSGTAWGISAIGADRSPYAGEGITVAVLDTGIDASHEAFAGMKLEQKNFTLDVDHDTNGHGTHCAGTIFGRAVNGHRIGVAPRIPCALIGKVIGKNGANSGQLVKAIQWAAGEGAQVISLSLGIDFPGYVARLIQLGIPAEIATSRALSAYRNNVRLFDRMADLLEAAAPFGQSCLLVAASGNESRTDKDPNFKVGASLPSAADGVVCVGAVARHNRQLVRAPFSNTGCAIVAPGVDIESARVGGGLTTLSGTSMATPHVAGVIALMAQKMSVQGPTKSKDLVQSLMASAQLKRFAKSTGPDDIGAGLVQAPM